MRVLQRGQQLGLVLGALVEYVDVASQQVVRIEAGQLAAQVVLRGRQHARQRLVDVDDVALGVGDHHVGGDVLQCGADAQVLVLRLRLLCVAAQQLLAGHHQGMRDRAFRQGQAADRGRQRLLAGDGARQQRQLARLMAHVQQLLAHLHGHRHQDAGLDHHIAGVHGQDADPRVGGERAQRQAAMLQPEEQQVMHGDGRGGDQDRPPVAVVQQQGDQHDHAEVDFGHAAGLLDQHGGQHHQAQRHGAAAQQRARIQLHLQRDDHQGRQGHRQPRRPHALAPGDGQADQAEERGHRQEQPVGGCRQLLQVDVAFVADEEAALAVRCAHAVVPYRHAQWVGRIRGEALPAASKRGISVAAGIGLPQPSICVGPA